jgi:hypothetical protein
MSTMNSRGQDYIEYKLKIAKEYLLLSGYGEELIEAMSDEEVMRFYNAEIERWETDIVDTDQEDGEGEEDR